MHQSIERVRAALAAAGATGEPVILHDAASTAAQAAAALGVEVGQIANSLIFDAAGEAVLVLASGGRRVDTAKVASALGVGSLERPGAEFVRSQTGFAIGGVPPLGHPTALRTLVDWTLDQHDTIWAAAGHPHAVFPTTFDELVRITGGLPADVLCARGVAAFMDVCLDASSADRMEPFWAAVLGHDLVRGDGSSYLTVPDGPARVWVNEVPEPKVVKNRVHLDVHCADVADLVALGAVVVRPPSETDHWWSLESPDGDEMCAFVRTEVPVNRLYEIVVDSADAVAQATWWAALLGGRENHEASGSYVDGIAGLPCDYIVFGPVPEPKTVKNRVHWDVRADVQDVVAHGGTVLRDPVPGDTGWHVVADPEGNEFCVFPA